MIEVSGSSILLEKDTFSVAQPGDTEENFWLKGLKYTLSLRGSNIRKVLLYSSVLPNNYDNAFLFTNTTGITWEYSEVAGVNATALTLAQEENEDANFEDGVWFYFIIKIYSTFNTQEITRKFFIKDPVDFIQVKGVAHEQHRPILIGSRELTLTVGENALNKAGVKEYGGVASIQIFDTPDALAPGTFVTPIAETGIESFSGEILLTERNDTQIIPNYISPWVDYDPSWAFHFITVRLRSKAGSNNYRDYPIILFAARQCVDPTNETDPYGVDSTIGGTSFVPCKLHVEESTSELSGGYCTSFIRLVFTLEEAQEFCRINEYETVDYVLYTTNTIDAEVIEIADKDQVIVIAPNEVEIPRQAFTGETTEPVSGYISPEKPGVPPVEPGERIEIYLKSCDPEIPEIEIDEPTQPDPPLPPYIPVTPKTGEPPFTPGVVYTGKLKPGKYTTEVTEEKILIWISETELGYPLTTEVTGSLWVYGNGKRITTIPPEVTTYTPPVYITVSSIEEAVFIKPYFTLYISIDSDLLFDVSHTYTIRVYDQKTGGTLLHTTSELWANDTGSLSGRFFRPELSGMEPRSGERIFGHWEVEDVTEGKIITRTRVGANLWPAYTDTDELPGFASIIIYGGNPPYPIQTCSFSSGAYKYEVEDIWIPPFYYDYSIEISIAMSGPPGAPLVLKTTLRTVEHYGTMSTTTGGNLVSPAGEKHSCPFGLVDTVWGTPTGNYVGISEAYISRVGDCIFDP